MAPKDQGGAPIESYFIEKRDLETMHWIKVARVDADVRTLKVINLIEGHEYHVRVSAENKFGKSLPLESGKLKPLRIYGMYFADSNLQTFTKILFLESQPSSYKPWSSLTNSKPYIDDLYIRQELEREDYYFRIYADKLLASVWESIDFSDLTSNLIYF